MNTVFDGGLGRFSRNVAPSDDPSTPWDEIIVYAWLVLYPGVVVVSCDDDTTPFTVLCIGKEMDDAHRALLKAQDTLGGVDLQRAKAVALAESAVSDAQRLLIDRRKVLDKLKADPDPIDVRNQKAAVALARARLSEAEADLAAVQGSPNPVALEVSRQKVDLTSAALSQAREDLTVLTAAADPVELEVRERQVALAEAELQAARRQAQ